ncbi:ATPase [Pseudomonas putida]|uniref:ATPase n=1 Tax=Pseudomonas putida TaxID=303 RepID=A0A1Q9QW67_PSEPU|nr:ATPase [Pseudomonas putida]OLS59404.1 hypothetical protein PSEMO_59140 [Pseudomonas putida]
MRNDARDDFDDVPTLQAVERDDDEFAPAAHPRSARNRAAKAPMVGPLWALLGASFIALAGVAWWSFQQISLMEQQLVATQESFARISEEAAGRLQVISGKVSASESSANTENEALKLQVRQLQASLGEQGKLQEGQAGELGKRLETAMAQVSQQQAANAALQTELQNQLAAVAKELTAVKAAQLDGGKIDGQIKSVADEVAALKAAKVDGSRIDTQLKNQAAATQRLEQDLIVLKSEQENRPVAAAGGGASTAEFDAFRGQVTRNINTLQSQVQNLQQQINAKN